MAGLRPAPGDARTRLDANRLLNDLGVPGLTAPLLKSMASSRNVILQPCVPGFEFPLNKTPQNVHYIAALLPEGSGDVPPQLQEARETRRTVILVSQGTIANGDLGQPNAVSHLPDRRSTFRLFQDLATSNYATLSPAARLIILTARSAFKTWL